MGIYTRILESILVEKPVLYNPKFHTKSGNAVLDKQGNKIGSYATNKAGKAVVKPLEAEPKTEPTKKKDTGKEPTDTPPEEDPKTEPKKTSGGERKRPESIKGINNAQAKLEKRRDMGDPGAGGAVASQGESRYCNAMNTLDVEDFKKQNRNDIDKTKQALSGKLSKNDQNDLRSIGLDPDSDEGLEYAATRAVFADGELERIKKIKGSVYYLQGKAGFGGPNGKADKAYKEWMRASYDGALATRKILKEDTDMDTSKPMTTMQSTGEVDDDVASDLQKRVDGASGEDKKYYQNELDDFQHFREYHDTYVVGQDSKGRTHIVSVSNKKGSDLRDPQNNTTPKKRFELIEEKQGKDVAQRVTTALEDGIEQVSDTKLSAIKKGNDIEIDDSVVAICDTEEMEKYMDKLDDNAKFQKFVKSKGIDGPTWKIPTKEKIQLMQEHSKELLTEGKPPPYEPYGKIWTKMGEFSRTQKFRNENGGVDFKSKSVQTSIQIKQAEKDAVASAHQNVVDNIIEADGGPKKSGEDNGPHAQGYVDTVMDAMHFNTYIDGGDKKMIVQMGIRGAQPSQVRGCLAEQSGFKGDVSDKKGKEALKDHLRKRCRIDQSNGNILIQDEGQERTLAMDTWRTAGTSQKVASGFGDDMRDCIMNKIDSKAAKGERGKIKPEYESLASAYRRVNHADL